MARTAVADLPARLAAIRERTDAALEGRWVGDPAFDALRIVAAETAMPHGLAWDVVEGFALDAASWRPATEDDLYRYCYHVAGAVGCMMAVVMGVAPTDEERSTAPAISASPSSSPISRGISTRMPPQGAATCPTIGWPRPRSRATP